MPFLVRAAHLALGLHVLTTLGQPEPRVSRTAHVPEGRGARARAPISRSRGEKPRRTIAVTHPLLHTIWSELPGT